MSQANPNQLVIKGVKITHSSQLEKGPALLYTNGTGVQVTILYDKAWQEKDEAEWKFTIQFIENSRVQAMKLTDYNIAP